MIDSNRDLKPLYKSDYVRILFFAIGIIMIVGLPLFIKEINTGMTVAVLGILVIDFFAGMTNYRRKGIIFFDACISFVGIVYFEITAAMTFYSGNSDYTGYFLFNQLLAILFFITLYITLRAYRKMPSQNSNL